jgi:ribosome-associated translation inhibitor RaiA
MLIQLNTDHHVDASDPFVRTVETDLEQSLSRFTSEITRIEVHFRDANADKGGSGDKRCLLEARLRGRDPIAVSNTAATLTDAYHGARDKLARMLDRQIARLRPTRGHDPFDNPELHL